MTLTTGRDKMMGSNHVVNVIKLFGGNLYFHLKVKITKWVIFISTDSVRV